MKISGFTFLRNASKLYYPVKESILSILPIVDEFVIALGKGDEDDNSRLIIESINSPKIKIIDTIWQEKYCTNGKIYAVQTNIAKNECKGDWLFYLQADEVVHERYLEIIVQRCQKYLNDRQIEGLIFDYKHFWGDYEHYHRSHGWYPNEIRIVKNNPNIHSWQDAQSFRYSENFTDPHQKEGTRLLKVAHSNAEIYHYGWVRPPDFMRKKSKAFEKMYKGEAKINEIYKLLPDEFDYGPLNRLSIFKETHPKVMQEMIDKMDWKHKLQYFGKPNPSRKLHKHERLKYQIVTFLEKYLNGGKQIGSFKNYNLVTKE